MVSFYLNKRNSIFQYGQFKYSKINDYIFLVCSNITYKEILIALAKPV